MGNHFELLTDQKGGCFTLSIDTLKAGEITFKYEGKDKIAIDHTEVFDGFSGQGIGKKLVAQVVEHAREKGYSVKTICPFAAKVFDQETAYADVRYE